LGKIKNVPSQQPVYKFLSLSSQLEMGDLGCKKGGNNHRDKWEQAIRPMLPISALKVQEWE
jgi:hypothetical protein